MSSSYSFYCRHAYGENEHFRVVENEVLTENGEGTEYLNHGGTLNVQTYHRYRLVMITWHDHRTKQSRTANMEHQPLCPSRTQAPRKLGGFCCMTQNTLFKDTAISVIQFLLQNHSSYYYLALGVLGCFPWSLHFLFLFFQREKTIISFFSFLLFTTIFFHTLSNIKA